MTIKELRKSKGLSQTECAKYLGMSLRNYQIYETSKDKVGSFKYNEIIYKLSSYGDDGLTQMARFSEFRTNVILGDALVALCLPVLDYKKRNCYVALKKYVDGNYPGKICVLYGLRRTGKTTLLFQLARELPLEQTAYIKVNALNTMSDLTKDLTALQKSGYKYVLIDEITLLSDFINTAATLSDIFSMMGMKIVVSGTDSLGFAMAGRDELYDRSITIHTSFISFREYASLLGMHDVDKYIEYGGTLKMENMSFDDPDSVYDDVSFRDDESTRKYIDTAISRNIQHTLKNDSFGEYFNQLRDLYEANELTNVINRIVENMNHRFVLRVIEEEFKSSDFGSAKNLLAHDIPNKVGYVLSEVDYKKIIERLMKIVDIFNKQDAKVMITQEHVDKVRKYLLMLDLIYDCQIRYESGSTEDYYVFVQPGMRFAIAKALVFSIKHDEHFGSLTDIEMNYVIDKILSDVKGRMLEDIVLLETKMSFKGKCDVFKYKFDVGGEFDMVVHDKSTNTCAIYEIKHSDKAIELQAKHLQNEEKCSALERRYGKIVSKNVLYKGDSKIINGISYMNVEEYLVSLK